MPPRRASKGSNQPRKNRNGASEFIEVLRDVPYPTPPPCPYEKVPDQSPADTTRLESFSEVFKNMRDISHFTIAQTSPYPSGEDNNQPLVKRRRQGKVSETIEVLGDVSFPPPPPYPSGKDTGKPPAKRTRKKKVPETIEVLGDIPCVPPPPYPLGNESNQLTGKKAKKQKVYKLIGVLCEPRPPPPPYPFEKMRYYRDPPPYPGLPKGQPPSSNRLPPPYPGTPIPNADFSNNPSTSQKKNNGLDSNQYFPEQYDNTSRFPSSTGSLASGSVTYSQSSGTRYASEIHPQTSVQMPYIDKSQCYEITELFPSSTGTQNSGNVTYSQSNGTRYASHPQTSIQMPYTDGPQRYDITAQFPSSTETMTSESVTYSQSNGTQYVSETQPETSIQMPYANILQCYEDASQIDINAQLPSSYESPASTSVLSPHSNKSPYPRHDLDINESFYSQGTSSYPYEHNYASPCSNMSEAMTSVSSPYTNEVQPDINQSTLYPDNAQWCNTNESQTESHIYNKPNHNVYFEPQDPSSYESNCSNQTSSYQHTAPYEEFMLLPDTYPSLPQPDVGAVSNPHNFQGYNENYQEFQYENFDFPQSGIPQ